MAHEGGTVATQKAKALALASLANLTHELIESYHTVMSVSRGSVLLLKHGLFLPCLSVDAILCMSKQA